MMSAFSRDDSDYEVPWGRVVIMALIAALLLWGIVADRETPAEREWRIACEAKGWTWHADINGRPLCVGPVGRVVTIH
jgi:hypothetical protein